MLEFLFLITVFSNQIRDNEPWLGWLIDLKYVKLIGHGWVTNCSISHKEWLRLYFEHVLFAYVFMVGYWNSADNCWDVLPVSYQPFCPGLSVFARTAPPKKKIKIKKQTKKQQKKPKRPKKTTNQTTSKHTNKQKSQKNKTKQTTPPPQPPKKQKQNKTGAC